MRKFVPIAVIAIMGLGANVHADTVLGNVSVNLVSVLGSHTVATSAGSIIAGPYNFILGASYNDGGQGLVKADNNARLYCIELAQYISTTDGPLVYKIKDPAEAPDPTATQYPLNPMGAEKAAILALLYAQNPVVALGGGTTTEQIAFQLAVWEVVHETVKAGTVFALTDFALTGTSAGFFYSATPEGTLATSMLSSVDMNGGPPMTFLALTNDTKQDFIYMRVPTPSALASLLGLGLMIGFVRFRRRKN